MIESAVCPRSSNCGRLVGPDRLFSAPHMRCVGQDRADRELRPEPTPISHIHQRILLPSLTVIVTRQPNHLKGGGAGGGVREGGGGQTPHPPPGDAELVSKILPPPKLFLLAQNQRMQLSCGGRRDSSKSTRSRACLCRILHRQNIQPCKCTHVNQPCSCTQRCYHSRRCLWHTRRCLQPKQQMCHTLPNPVQPRLAPSNQI